MKTNNFLHKRKHLFNKKPATLPAKDNSVEKTKFSLSDQYILLTTQFSPIFFVFTDCYFYREQKVQKLIVEFSCNLVT